MCCRDTATPQDGQDARGETSFETTKRISRLKLTKPSLEMIESIYKLIALNQTDLQHTFSQSICWIRCLFLLSFHSRDLRLTSKLNSCARFVRIVVVRFVSICLECKSITLTRCKLHWSHANYTGHMQITLVTCKLHFTLHSNLNPVPNHGMQVACKHVTLILTSTRAPVQLKI